MIYSHDISTPKNKEKADEQITELKLTAGIIHQVDIVFPSGCAGLASIALFHGLHQLWPTNPEEYFHTDGETISFKEFYRLTTEPYIIEAKTYNLDTAHAHSIIVRIGLLKQSEIQGVWLPWSEEVIE